MDTLPGVIQGTQMQDRATLLYVRRHHGHHTGARAGLPRAEAAKEWNPLAAVWPPYSASLTPR